MKTDISDGYLKAVRDAIRVDELEFDDEIKGLILSAREELRIAGIKRVKCYDESDALIFEAIKTYGKANFGLENADRAAYLNAFESMKLKLAISIEYAAGEGEDSEGGEGKA